MDDVMHLLYDTQPPSIFLSFDSYLKQTVYFLLHKIGAHMHLNHLISTNEIMTPIIHQSVSNVKPTLYHFHLNSLVTFLLATIDSLCLDFMQMTLPVISP